VNRFLEWFAGNHVAANLLMAFIILAGLVSVSSIRQEVFPEISLDIVSIAVPYPGASPAEVEEAVCIRIEEAIFGVDGIKRVTSSASENSGSVIAELASDADPQIVLDEIKQEVDRIVTFPKEVEKPVVRLVVFREKALNVVLYGDLDEASLKALAENVRDELLALPEITQASLVGIRPYEISIEVGERELQRYGLTFDHVTRAIKSSSLDLPGGSIKTESGEVLIRTKGQRYTGREFAGIVLITAPDGTRVTLGSVADVRDGFEEIDMSSRFDGKPAVMVAVYRVNTEGILDVTAAVKDYVEIKKDTLPAGISMETWSDRSLIYQDRLELMVKNGLLGLILVFGCLSLLLQPRVAFWVALGIPISFLGGFWILPMFGGSLNMISMFGFIVVLGLVVDDAIVIGENVYTHRRLGKDPFRAAVDGVREVSVPVILAVTTTVFAFFPLAVVEGIMGKFLGMIPIVVISVLVISLVEGLMILPAHLTTVKKLHSPESGGMSGLQSRFSLWFEHFVDTVYRPFLEKALSRRALVIATALAIMALLLGYVFGGHIRFTFMPNIDADEMICTLEMPAGTTYDKTEEAVRRITDGLEKTRLEVEEDSAPDAKSVFEHIFTSIGAQPATDGGRRPGGGADVYFAGSHVAEVYVQLLKGEERGIASTELLRSWREHAGDIPGAVALSFTSDLFHGSSPFQLQLSSGNPDMLPSAAAQVKAELTRYPGIRDITDSFEEGKLEIRLNLKPEARLLGVTLDDLGRQVRSGFYGAEVLRIQRGRDEVRVMVRYPGGERLSTADVENMMIRTGDGSEVPFGLVATVEEGRGYASISRVDRMRTVDVRADVDQKVTNAGQVQRSLQADFLPGLLEEFPGLVVSFEGEERDRIESMQSLMKGFLVALLLIYALLAVLFRSYSQPIIIMTAIPFGLLGAVLGHIIMGMDLTLLSIFGVVALTGVVVNDSLIMIDFINRRRRGGAGIRDAVIESGTRRFRPIILTSLTTFAGLSPMLLEKSLQARFLIPMTVSLGFGVIFATAITLILVPVSYSLLEDVRRMFSKRD